MEDKSSQITAGKHELQVSLLFRVIAQELDIDPVTKLYAAAAFAMFLRSKIKKFAGDIHDCSVPLAINEDGSVVCPATVTISNVHENILTPDPTPADKIEHLLREALFAVECVAAGDLAAQRAAANIQTTRAEIRAGKSTQKEPVELKADGNIYLTNTTAVVNVKTHLSFIKAAEEVNTLGLTIEVVIGNQHYKFAPLRQGATKATGLIVGTRTIIAPVTGYFRTKHEVEVLIDGKAKYLSAKDRGEDMLIEADQTGAKVEMIVEVSGVESVLG